MLRLHLSGNQSGPTLSGRCICTTFAQICTSVGTVTNTTAMYYQKNTTQTSIYISLGSGNAQVTFKLQPKWPHPFCQVYLHHLCTRLHFCGHSDQYDQNVLSKKAQPKLQFGWVQHLWMLRLHLSGNQSGPTLSGRCICTTIAQVCTSVGTVTNTTAMYYQKITTQTSIRISLGSGNAQVTFKLQPKWPQPFWQVYLHHLCTSLHLCGHSDQYDHNASSKKHNQNFHLDELSIWECSGYI